MNFFCEAKKPAKSDVRYIARSSSNEKFNKWASTLLAKGYRHMAFNGTKFMMSASPISPEKRNNGPYSRITADTKPSLVRDTLMTRMRGDDRRVMKESTDRLIKAVNKAIGNVR
jgi:hypothetical protein